ncbi:unnamed protein product [Polarella glacialis]|uniref:Natural resistance-associated macrophage protein n=1 Tax=Polarella glacialis TaxID=89957 RepID=A0A813K0I8_POLGL|nr:unnamed protein product [Polarella glacialis]
MSPNGQGRPVPPALQVSSGNEFGRQLSPSGSLGRQLSPSGSVVTFSPFGLLKSPESLPASPSVGECRPDLAAAVALAIEGGSEAAYQVLEPGPGVELSDLGRSETGWWRRLLTFTGPGWLMSIAYVDPGNLEADLQSGAQFGYRLLWALFAATVMGLGMQLIAARLGCATRKHLAEHCRDVFEPKMRIMLWLLTELAIIGSDVQEVIGCSIGLQLLFGLSLPKGVCVTALAAFGFLFLERLGTRPLELFFGTLILVLACSMWGLFVEISPDTGAVLEGLVVPRLPAAAMQQVVGMIGCVIMPHNLFLHSALVQSRVVRKGEEAEAIMFFSVESTAAILTSLLINVAVVAVFAKGFYGNPDSDAIGLRNAGDYLGNAFGEPLKVIWAVGLIAAGQSSTMTGAYAGQWVMQGYLELKVTPWKRAIITRSMALVPCLSVAIYFGGDRNQGLDMLNTYLNVLQSFVLPFAVVPLLTLAGSRKIMGDELVLPPGALLLAWLATALITVANIYLFVLQFWEFSAASLCTGISVYVAAVLCVAWEGQRRLREVATVAVDQ